MPASKGAGFYLLSEGRFIQKFDKLALLKKDGNGKVSLGEEVDELLDE